MPILKAQVVSLVKQVKKTLISVGYKYLTLSDIIGTEIVIY